MSFKDFIVSAKNTVNNLISDTEKHNYDIVNDSNSHGAYGRWITVIDRGVELQIKKIKQDIEGLESLKGLISSLKSSITPYYSDLIKCYAYTKGAFEIADVNISDKVNEIQTLANNINKYSDELMSVVGNIDNKIIELENEKKKLEPKLEIKKWIG